MAGRGPSSGFECPVCTDLFRCPKILPCNHLVCRKCILSWLQKGGLQGGCPICRDPILPFTGESEDVGHLEAKVDELQTDLATQILAESFKVVTGQHVCAMCQSSVPACEYCLQCAIKLCESCTDYHKKLPGTKDHSLEQLRTLTVNRLASLHLTKCKHHGNRFVELYCSVHHELICLLCATTSHRGCSEANAIPEMAKEKRELLKERVEGLKHKGRELAEQVVADKFKAMRTTANEIFDDLHLSVENRRHEVLHDIHAEEVATQTAIAELEKVWTSVTSHCQNIEYLVISSPDDALLEMLQRLASRLDVLESQSEITEEVKDVGELILDDQITGRVKSDLAKLGQTKTHRRQPTSSHASVGGATPRTDATASGWISAAKPRGAALAQVLKVGDRVKAAPEWEDEFLARGHGTVISIPSRRVAALGIIPAGWVDVRWDSGDEYWHCMGCKGRYDLELI